MSFIYNGDPDRVYPALGLIAEPGDSRDDAEPLDWRWKASDATDTPAAPATSDATTTQPDASAEGTTTADPAPATAGGNS